MLHKLLPFLSKGMLTGVLGVFALGGLMETSGQDKTAPLVTPVEGPSWMKHLGIADIQSTALGQMVGTEPASASRRQEPDLPPAGEKGSLSRTIDKILSLFRSESRQTSKLMDETFVLAGSDLYRLNCQSCHGPVGVGSPPEIKSLLGPVEGTSPALIQGA